MQMRQNNTVVMGQVQSDLIKQREAMGRRRGGFSLLELSLVVVIMGILVAVVAVNVSGQGDKAKRNATKIKLQDIKRYLEQYKLEKNVYPPELSGLVAEKLIEANKTKDGWETELNYDPRGRNADQPFILSSSGPNKVLGDEDDMSVWDIK
jgi:general secretion pathway protein G